MLIDTSFDFRRDAGGKDPDAYSVTLCRYHQLLWSKVLPSGALFGLESSRRRPYFLHHSSELGQFFLTSDSITHTYTRWSRLKRITELFSEEENEAFRTIGYTIGGMLVFPGNMIEGKQTINGARGCHSKIRDRFDLTLECIRRHYIGQHSPLDDTLKRYGGFFALFEDFRGYVDYFLLQDLVVDDYSAVTFLMPFDDFRTSPVPGDVDTYREYRRLTIEFVEARNRRIDRHTKLSCAVDHAIEPVSMEVVRPSRVEISEAQALAEAQAMYGADAMVWIMTHDLKGQPYKTPRYRVGYKAETQTGRFIENGRRMKGVGGSWDDAVCSAKNFATPRL
jgi:hypothetical protein